MTLLVEACADGVDSALGAAAGGAGRLELCDNLLEGGTTPSAGMIEVVRDRVTLPLFVLVRTPVRVTTSAALLSSMPPPGDEFGRAGTDPARIHHIVASVPAAGGAIPSSPRAGRS